MIVLQSVAHNHFKTLYTHPCTESLQNMYVHFKIIYNMLTHGTFASVVGVKVCSVQRLRDFLLLL